jgi:hypothetical protein
MKNEQREKLKNLPPEKREELQKLFFRPEGKNLEIVPMKIDAESLLRLTISTLSPAAVSRPL